VKRAGEIPDNSMRLQIECLMRFRNSVVVVPTFDNQSRTPLGEENRGCREGGLVDVCGSRVLSCSRRARMAEKEREGICFALGVIPEERKRHTTKHAPRD
jgi:hypothetical protein